jgi:hypothetical protein
MDHVEEGPAAAYSRRSGRFRRSIRKNPGHVLQVPGSGPMDLHYGKNSYISTLERRVLERVPLNAAPVRVCERKVAPETSVTEIEKNTGIFT